MEAMNKDQSPRPAVSSGSKLRYPLRSSAKSKAATADPSDSSSSRRTRPFSSVSQSVGVLDLSAKEISAKPPRRLSIPTKSAIRVHQASDGSITPISETRLNRSNAQGRSDTPLSDASRSAGRRKFCLLSSVSYWLTQIKLSEAASKHSVSLGFFKLALESGCEPAHKIREELKSYVLKHNLLTELEEPAKDLLQSYNVVEDLEQLKLSGISAQLQEEGTCASTQDLRRSSASGGSGKLKPRSLISNPLTVAKSFKESVEKIVPPSKNRVSNIKNLKHTALAKDANGKNIQKSQKRNKVEPIQGNAKVKGSTKESVSKEGDSAEPVPMKEISLEDKENIEDIENMDNTLMEGALLEEEIRTS